MDIAKSVGAPRILRGFAITCPVGNPTIGNYEDEKNSRRIYVEKALELLTQEGNPDIVHDI